MTAAVEQVNPYGDDEVNAYMTGPHPHARHSAVDFLNSRRPPAVELAPGESILHVQRTYHLHGDRGVLDGVAKRLLGAPLAEIETAFDN